MNAALNSLPVILPPHAIDYILRATIAVTGWLCMAWRLSGCATDARATTLPQEEENTQKESETLVLPEITGSASICAPSVDAVQGCDCWGCNQGWKVPLKGWN